MEYYLGPQSWPLWARKLLPFAREFSSSGQFHDMRYERGTTETDRFVADSFFLKLMLARTVSMGKIRGLAGRFYARAYYLAVRLFGNRYFNYDVKNKQQAG